MSEAIGKVNRYVCGSRKCRAVHGTINLNTGTTPFLIRCRSCNEMAQSSMYHLPEGPTACGWAWYRPTAREFRRLMAETQEHVLGGGLILGDLAEVTTLREPEDLCEKMQRSDVDSWLAYVASAYVPDPEQFHRIVERLKGTKR